jgi:phosphate-selective porin OprO/OprP
LHSRRFLYAVLLLILAATVAAQDVPAGGSADKAPILIENVRPWDAGSPEGTVNVLISAGKIERISNDAIVPPGDAIDVDGEGRYIVGRLLIGESANVVVMDENPSADLTLLTDPDALFLVVRKGEIESGEYSDTLAAPDPTTFRVVDAARFRIVRVKKEPWYSYRNDRLAARFIAGALLDRTTFNANEQLESQVGGLNSYDSGEVRTLRLGVGGIVKGFNKDFIYAFVGSSNAFKQDFNSREGREFDWIDWAIGVELFGAWVRIGKQKENFSHDRNLLLIDQPFMERPMAVTAMTLSRNTGISVRDTALGGRLFWSVGSYFDMLGDRDEPYKDARQYTARVTGLPHLSDDGDQLLHLGIAYRYNDTDSGVLRYSSNPEAFFSPAFVDTGEFAASNANSTSFELGFKRGPVWMMSELIHTDVNANEFDDPTFTGFHVSGTWSLTGERRDYDLREGLFDKLIPLKNVHSGGTGAWELVARYSELDLSDGLIEGGEMSRWSVGINWWPTREFKTTLQYGWIDLDRFGISSSSEVLQLRGTMQMGL